MSNKKISALTSASTPLAGTETLPVVQSSATTKVSVENLTAGRTIQALNVLVNTASNPGALNNAVVVNSGANPYAGLHLFNNATGSAYNNGVQLLTNGTAAYLYNFSNDSLYIALNGYTVQYQFAPSGDFTFKTGNLVQGAAAKGVNFTANTPATGMTSQLLNWYEEGNYTPTLTPGSGSFTSATATAYYTRVGRSVTVQLTISITTNGTAATDTRFTLPLTASASIGATGICREIAVAGTCGYVTIPAGSSIGYIGTFAGGYLGGNGYLILATITYQV
jgi:hypothetical protein